MTSHLLVIHSVTCMCRFLFLISSLLELLKLIVDGFFLNLFQSRFKKIDYK